MFEFKKTENTEEFDAFVENSHETSFMQTSRWIPLKPTWKPHMFTGYEDGKVVLTALILERSMPVAGKLWYSPSGFIADYENRELVSAFSAFIKAQMKKERVTAYIADPQIVKRITGEDVPETCAKEQNLVNAGFVCNDDRDNYTYQPPMTVAVRLKTDENTYTAEKLLKTFEKGVRYSVRIGSKRGLVTEQYRYSDLCENPQLYEDFLSVMNDTSERVGFVTRPHDYYLDFIRQFDKWTTVDLIYYDAEKDKSQYEADIKRLEEINGLLENETRKSAVNKYKNEQQSLESSVEAYRQREGEVASSENDRGKSKICVACGVTIRFAGEACCLFGGTRNILRNNVRSSHSLNYIRIKQSIDEDISVHDMGRVPDEYTRDESPHNGLYKFKMSFAADRLEYIGEYVLVGNKLKYLFYKKVMPAAKKANLKLVKLLKSR